jgi:predicted metal-binding membrane protein
MKAFGRVFQYRLNLEQIVLLGLMLVLLFVAWMAMYDMSWMHWGGNYHCGKHSNTFSFISGILNFCMWVLMMVAMMLPSFLKSVLLFTKMDQSKNRRISFFGIGNGIYIVLGYLSAWAGYSLLGTSLQFLLLRLNLLSSNLSFYSMEWSGGLLITTGIFQFSCLKDKCLSQCKSPLGFFLTSWKEGALGAFQMGWSQGVYCVGCCLLLMALMFVGGVMSLSWMIGLTVLVLAEKWIDGKFSIRKTTGIALIGWGLFLWISK